MIVLDTNVVSELARARPNAAVVAWLDARPATHLGTTAVTAAELLYGVRRLPAGRRRDELNEVVRDVLENAFRGRILPFDTSAAAQYADLVAERDAVGRPISMADAQIAAICRSRRAPLATRNLSDFRDSGVELLDPWAET